MACHDDHPDFFLDQKWRITKNQQHYPLSDQTSPTPNPNPNPNSTFLRSRSMNKHRNSKPSSSSLSKSSSVRLSRRNTSPPALRRSSSTTTTTLRHQSPPNDDKSPPLLRSLSRKGSSFTRKCTSLAKEQKARFYIIRRCVSMLVRWSKHRDS